MIRHLLPRDLLCRIGGHRRAPRLWHVPGGYRSTCRRCGVGLERGRDEHGWRVTAPHG